MYIEIVSGAGKRRPVFEALIASLEVGDTLVVWALDRAFRSAIDAVTQAEMLRARGVEFEIVNLRMDTKTAEGFFAYWMMCGCAEFERRILIKRTREGLAAARRKGVRLGRPPKLSARDLEKARRAVASGSATYASLAREFGMQPWSVSRALKREAEAYVER